MGVVMFVGYADPVWAWPIGRISKMFRWHSPSIAVALA